MVKPYTAFSRRILTGWQMISAVLALRSQMRLLIGLESIQIRITESEAE